MKNISFNTTIMNLQSKGIELFLIKRVIILIYELRRQRNWTFACIFHLKFPISKFWYVDKLG